MAPRGSKRVDKKKKKNQGLYIPTKIYTNLNIFYYEISRADRVKGN